MRGQTGRSGAVKGIFHVNVTDSERSLTFYELLGFRIVRDLGECGTEHLGHGLDFENPVGRAALLMIGDDRYATRLESDRMEAPPAAGTPYLRLYHAVINRIALWTDTLHETYAQLEAGGVRFIFEPQIMTDPGSATSSFVCFSDLDGTVIELRQFS